jgi:hypothetical protein
MNDSDVVLVELPRELVERISYRMEAIDDDADYWALYCGCLAAINESIDQREVFA